MGRPGVVLGEPLPAGGVAMSLYCNLFGTNRLEDRKRRFGTRRDGLRDFAPGKWARLVA